MSPYQQIFSTNAVLSVWRNLRNTKDKNDFFLALQYHHDDAQGTSSKKYGKIGVVESTQEVTDGRAIDTGGKSIGFVVPWRSMQAQRRELREKEKELAEALVIRHLAAGLSRQMSRIELQMADNAPFANGKNLHTGSEIAKKFLPAIQTLFEQRPIPQRMIFELLMELKDLVYMGMAGCSKEVLGWELDNRDMHAFEEMDDAIVRAITPIIPSLDDRKPSQLQEIETGHKRLLKRRPSNLTSNSLTAQRQPVSFLLASHSELLFALESLETTATALTQIPLPIPDMYAHAIITMRRLAPRQPLTAYTLDKKNRSQHCAEYARCMKWAGNSWRQSGGCRKGCVDEEEDLDALPSWHRKSRWFDEGVGTCMVGGGRVV
ncbi:hypothetical protein T440DRAFT_441069 [Plenodomus tracheiphilus IPT5]|uniref:Uncharacterized protein n=1 Tax=Plenodomus tracheiphilus IPT5 TaxID=1408161 RepID=A0A6A7BK53_9PLEO|nr:hypothetical protein T440DRAFT_441069 [Plenodomus tracheiphilus IPT5]